MARCSNTPRPEAVERVPLPPEKLRIGSLGKLNTTVVQALEVTVRVDIGAVPETLVTPAHSMLEPLVPPSAPMAVPPAVVVSRQPTANLTDLSVYMSKRSFLVKST